MKILLINPPCGERTIGLKNIARIEPLSLELVGAGVSKDHEVRLVDMLVRPEDLDETLAEFHPDVVGVTTEIVRVPTSLQVLQQIRKKLPNALTVIGGCHPTLCPTDLYDPAVDVICIGEGVDSFREICAAREKNRPVTAIAGLHVRTANGWVVTPPRPQPVTLDDQPLPDRSLTTQYRKDYFYLFEPQVAAIRTSFGCSYPCNFCSCRMYSQMKFVPRSARMVFEEIRSVREEFVMFCDDHSFHNPERMWELGNLLLESGIRKRYFAYARTDSIVANRDLFALWAKVGLTIVMTGLEALDEKTLRRTGKRTDTAQNEEAVAILKGLGIQLSAGFLVNPHFTEEDFSDIRRYLKNHPSILLAECTPLTPFPGTPLYSSMKKQLLTGDYQVYDLQHFVIQTDLPAKQLYRLMLSNYGFVFWRVVGTILRTAPRSLFSWHVARVLIGILKNWRQFLLAHRSTPPYALPIARKLVVPAPAVG